MGQQAQAVGTKERVLAKKKGPNKIVLFLIFDILPFTSSHCACARPLYIFFLHILLVVVGWLLLFFCPTRASLERASSSFSRSHDLTISTALYALPVVLLRERREGRKEERRTKEEACSAILPPIYTPRALDVGVDAIVDSGDLRPLLLTIYPRSYPSPLASLRR